MTRLFTPLSSRPAYIAINIIILSLIGLSDSLAIANIHTIIRVGVGFIWFLLPGTCIGYLLSNTKHRSWIISIGLSLPISLALIGVFGILARTIHLSIYDINFVWYLLSIALTSYIIFTYQSDNLKNTSQGMDKTLIGYALVAMGIILIFVVVAPWTMKKVNDTLLHNADITHFVSGQPLSWEEIYFDSGNSVSDRNGTSYLILGQALIVHVSDVHILDAQSHISAFLIFSLGASVFASARLFGYSTRNSLIILILHFTAIAMMTSGNQAGRLVLRHIFQDKILAGFALAPIVFGVTYQVIQYPDKRNFLLLALLIIGLILTHAILAGFVIAVIGLWMLFNIILTQRLHPNLLIAILCVTLFSPLIFIRQTTDLEYNFGDDAPEANDRIWLDESSGLYIASPNAIGEVSLFLLLSASVLSLFHIKTQPMARLYIASLIIVALGLVPYTASIYGRFVGIYNIFRVGWIIPHGLLAFYIAEQIANVMQNRFSDGMIAISKRMTTVSIFVIAPCIVAFQAYTLIEFEFAIESDQLNHEAIQIGQFIESEQTGRIVVLGDTANSFQDYLGAISHLIQPVAFCDERCMINFTGIDADSADSRLSRSRNFFSDRHDNEKRIQNLNRYDVDYIIYQKETGGQYVTPLIEEFPDMFKPVYETSLLSVVKYLPPTE